MNDTVENLPVVQGGKDMATVIEENFGVPMENPDPKPGYSDILDIS